MKRREVTGVVAALLLAVPLVMLVLGVMHPERWAPGPSDTRVSPVLEFEARMRLQSYRRCCHTRGLEDMRARTAYCTDSERMTDRECPEGQQCRNLASRGGVPMVRVCIPLGERLAGERSYHVPTAKDDACGPNLLCVGEGWCARTCRLDAPRAARGIHMRGCDT